MSFVTRKDDLDQLYDLVMARENLFLYAPEGMGKSTLLNVLYPRLTGRRICFYLNFRGLSDELQFLQKLLSNLQSSMASHSNLDFQFKRFLRENPLPEEASITALNNWIENLLVALQGMSQDFLFVFEDLQQWEGEAEPSKFFKHFYRSRNSHFIITARSHRDDFGKTTPFELKPLSIGNFTEAFASEFSDTALQELLTYTRGNTSFVLEVIEKGALSEDGLNANTSRLMEDYHSFFYNFRKRYTDLQWRLMRAIAQDDRVARPHSFEFLMKHKLGAASSVERALKNLSETGMIIRHAEGWELSNVLFQRWLQWLYNK